MSEVEKLPQGWVKATVDDLAEFVNGFAFKPAHWESTGTPIIRIQNLTNSEKPFNYTKIDVPDIYEVNNGDLLVSWSATLDAFIWRGDKAWLNQHIFKVVPIPGAFHSGLLFYWMKIAIEEMITTEHLHGSTMKHINRGPFLAHETRLPPSNEQARIFDKLEELFSELDAGVKELKAAQTKLSQYRQSLLKSAVEGSLTQQWRAENSDRVQETGEQLLARILKQRREQWQQQKLAEFAEKGKMPPKNWQDKYSEPVRPDTTDLPKLPEGWVWASLDMIISKVEAGKSFKCLERPPELDEYGVVKVSAVTWGEYNEQESKTCTRADLENDTILIKEEDFLFSRANTTELVGACVIAKGVSRKVMLSDKILRLRFVEDKLKYWLLQFMRGELGRTQIEYAATGNQASMKNVSQGKLLKFAVPLPPLSEVEEVQRNLTSAFQYIVNSASEAEITLKFLHAQRKNILKSAFSGQLEPQDPNDAPASLLLEKIKQEREALAKIPKLRKPRKPKKVDIMNTLLEVLTAEKDWIGAQDAFQKCGIVDGTSTDRIEEIYTELRKLEKAGKIQIQRLGDFDQLKLITQNVKED
ncbi:restriction endonuclease subunit S [Pseudoalteromonas sp. SG41-5]|uniref:restriction endonuclease subunit S n=1 Tax=Pseudoalteromonas sp. SG41-5 TaxID=2760975 RepID=UPI0016038B0D|nr:restriction endonuclease subunit S [Pseudoalteromonas sp. SG41-5]MBB1468225.1 restriction endonuclease subunit S [Pseudoalteromonas sp. SG41-5]